MKIAHNLPLAMRTGFLVCD